MATFIGNLGADSDERSGSDPIAIMQPSAHTALEWAIRNGETVLAARISEALEPVWRRGAGRHEGSALLDELLTGAIDLDDEVRSRLMVLSAHLLGQIDARRAVERADEARSIARSDTAALLAELELLQASTYAGDPIDIATARTTAVQLADHDMIREAAQAHLTVSAHLDPQASLAELRRGSNTLRGCRRRDRRGQRELSSRRRVDRTRSGR